MSKLLNFIAIVGIAMKMHYNKYKHVCYWFSLIREIAVKILEM